MVLPNRSAMIEVASLERHATARGDGTNFRNPRRVGLINFTHTHLNKPDHSNEPIVD